MASEVAKLSPSANFFPSNLRDLAAEFNRLRAQPSCPQRTAACDQLVAKALTQCMELGPSTHFLDDVIDDALKASAGRAPSERRWETVIYLLENSPLFMQNIARAVVQEVAVAKLVPFKLLKETIDVVQRQGSIKDYDAPIRKPWMDTVLPLLQRLQQSASLWSQGEEFDLICVHRHFSVVPTMSPPPAVAAPDRRSVRTQSPPVQRSLIGSSRDRPASHRAASPPQTGVPHLWAAPAPRYSGSGNSTAPTLAAAASPTPPRPPSPKSPSSPASASSFLSVASVSPPQSPPRGTLLPEARAEAVENVYLFGKQLGKGSFATVFEGMHRQSRTPVALKAIPKLKIGSSEAQQMLRNEVTSLLQLNHPHIVRLFDVFEDSAKFTLVLELLRGREMFDKLVEKGRYSEQDASAAMRQVLDAVAYLHSNRIAHRDLKPENILSVERNGREIIKLADFGLARSFGDGSAMSTACGSPLYVAPEIIRGEKYGPAVDVWACGVIIFILLSGVSPFPNGPDTNILFRAIHANEWTFGVEWANISEDAKDMVKRLMTSDPRTRLTASEALQHPWILRATALPSLPLNAAYAALSRSSFSARP